MARQSLKRLLKDLSKKPKEMPDKDKLEDEIQKLQLRLLQIQQANYLQKGRVIIMFEGFDAAGKGGAIRTITEKLDPRSVSVVPIAAPSPMDQGKHWLYRFWVKLPGPGHITIFDRSWYGRVLVEKVEGFAPKGRLKEAFGEINEFEKLLQDDGITLIKIFLAVTKDEQLERFEERLTNPFKRWKITEDDIRARRNWDQYVAAVDEFLKHNDPKSSPWHLIPANSKKFARRETLRIVTDKLAPKLKGFTLPALDKKQKRFLRELRTT